MDWETFIKETSVFTIALGIIALLVRSIIINKFNKDFETYRIRYLKLHHDRSQVIRELYSRLVKMQRSMASFMKPFQTVGEQSQDEKADVAREDANAFIEYYQMNSIFFQKEICELLDDINKRFLEVWVDFTSYLGEPHDSQERIEKRKAWTNAWEVITEKIPEIESELRDEFRKLLGVQ